MVTETWQMLFFPAIFFVMAVAYVLALNFTKWLD
jgi:hypothetical protein